ncbi:MAG: hypothetical protein L0H96_06720 [Humibacillus sp.]|nr:hypothetical protein [Humibacillus sp.]MDN5776585.1 hypothetical protein [Humibacillus sp.]
MSDSTKTILWIALAVVVILVIVWVVMSSRRRRMNDERRFQAGELRAEAQQKAPLLQESTDRASVTEQIAADARAEADKKAAAAAALEDQAQAHRAVADGVKAERDDLTREADRIDPDVATDDAGHRVDQSDDADHGADAAADRRAERDADHGAEEEKEAASHGDQPAETAATAGPAAVGATGVLGGASTLDDHDDEPDLADAHDPFATTGDEEAAAGYDEDMRKKKRDAKADTSGSAAVSADPGPDEAAPVDAATQADGDLESGATGHDADAAEGSAAADGPPVATATQPTEVSVPALDDRDDVLVAGGPPDNDSGDHRGQPWATTPGEPGLDEGDEVADNTNEGFAAHTPSEAAPESDADAAEQGSEQHDSGAPEAERSDAAESETAAPAVATGASTADSADHRSETDSVDDSSTESAGASLDESSTESTDEGANDEGARDAEPADAEPADAEPADDQTGGQRRISSFDEVVDGGYGIGSARPIDDGAQPLAHEVKAWTDRKSFSAPGDEGYDGAEPDVWFYNEDAARRAGFSRDGD